MECPMCGAGPIKILSEKNGIKNIKCDYCCYAGEVVDKITMSIMKAEAEGRGRAMAEDEVKSKIDAAVSAKVGEIRSSGGGEAVYDKNRPAVLEISCKFQGGGSSGTGFIINRFEGYVLTNTHVIADEKNNCLAESVVVRTSNSKAYPADIIAYGKMNFYDDLAILKINCGTALDREVTLGDSNSVKNGQPVFLIGNPIGQGISITGGIVSDNNRRFDAGPMIMIDASSNPGNSGGPAFNSDSKVIGVLVAGTPANVAVGMYYTIPINHAKEFIRSAEQKIGKNILPKL